MFPYSTSVWTLDKESALQDSLKYKNCSVQPGFLDLTVKIIFIQCFFLGKFSDKKKILRHAKI